jgi:hypothetical protein
MSSKLWQVAKLTNEGESDFVLYGRRQNEKKWGLSQDDLAEAMVCIEYTLVEWNLVNEILVEQVFESCKRRIVGLLAVTAIL